MHFLALFSIAAGLAFTSGEFVPADSPDIQYAGPWSTVKLDGPESCNGDSSQVDITSARLLDNAGNITYTFNGAPPLGGANPS